MPFIFATGYGERAALPQELTHIPAIQKTYSMEGIRAALRKWNSQLSIRKN